MSSNQLPRWGVVVSVLLLSVIARGEPATTPTVTSPKGDYAIARLDLPEGLGGGPQKLLLALRDGKLANFWFVTAQDGDKRLTVRSSDVTLAGNKLGGTVALRTAPYRQRAMVDATLKLALEVSGAKVAGTYEFDCADPTVYKPAKGTATGTFESAPAAADKLPGDAAWASFYGPDNTMTVSKQPPLIDDLAKARPVWRSEVYVPTGYGNAPDSRYFTRALVAGNGGGGSSPVIADGTVYMYFYVPTPSAEVHKKGNPFWERSYPDEAAFQKAMADLKATPEEAERILNHFRVTADDHVVAIDAATGATKWEAVLPARSPNLQTHKHRGISGVPLVAGKTLFVPNLAGRLYALDTASGKLKWEIPEFNPASKMAEAKGGPTNPSPLLIGDVLVWSVGGKTLGLDPETGKQKWDAPGGYFQQWTSNGQPRLVIFGGDPNKRLLTAVDPASGKVLWKKETELSAGAANSAVASGDTLVAAVSAKAQAEMPFSGWKLSDTGVEKIWDAEPIKPDENVPLAISGGKVWIIGRDIVRVLDLATGKKLVERTEWPDRQGPGSNPWLGLFGDKVLLSPEGQHGSAGLVWLDPATLKSVGSFWHPANTSTTAYNSQPIVYPILNGRLFLRGGDGVYCYDLRKQ